MIVVDGSMKPLGRLASEVAQLLKRGYPVTIINAEKIVVSGTLEGVLPKFLRRYRLRSLGNPIKHTPRWPRTVEGIVRKAVEGMIDRKDRARLMKRLKVVRGSPSIDGKLISIDIRIPSKYVMLEDLSKAMGGK